MEKAKEQLVRNIKPDIVHTLAWNFVEASTSLEFWGRMIRRLLFLGILFCALVPNYSLALPGTAHVQDMLNVVLGDAAVRNPELRESLKEFTKTIDNFEVVKGLPLGKSGHRLYGHWGFSEAIPFNTSPELKSLLQSIAEKEGPEAAELAKQRIIKSWSADARKLIQLSERMLGVGGRSARGLAGLLYTTHLLGDYSGEKLNSLQDINALSKDLQKNIHRLLGNNSPAAIKLSARIEKVVQASGSKNSQVLASKLLNELKTSPELSKSIQKLINARATASLFKTGMATNIVQPKNISSAQRQARKLLKNGKIRTVPAQLLPKGRLLAAASQGAGAGLLCFALEGGSATFQYMRGNMYAPEYREKLAEAALSGATTAAELWVAQAVTPVLAHLIPVPGGLVVAAVSIGATMVFDVGKSLYKKNRESKMLTREDLAVLGIEIDSVLEPELDKYTIFEPETEKNSILEPELDKNSILEPELDKYTIFEPELDSIFE